MRVIARPKPNLDKLIQAMRMMAAEDAKRAKKRKQFALTHPLTTTSLTCRSEQELPRRVVTTANAFGDVADDEPLLSQPEDLSFFFGREASLPGLDTLFG